MDFGAHLFQLFSESAGYVGSPVDAFGVGWCAGFGVEPPGAAAFVGSVPNHAGGVLAGLVADHAVVFGTGGGEVGDVGESAKAPIQLGVVYFHVCGGYAAVGGGAAFAVGSGEGHQALFAGGQPFAAAEVERDGGGVFEYRQPGLGVSGEFDEVGDGDEGAGGGGGETGFADQVVEVGLDDQLRGVVRGGSCPAGRRRGQL